MKHVKSLREINQYKKPTAAAAAMWSFGRTKGPKFIECCCKAHTQFMHVCKQIRTIDALFKYVALTCVHFHNEQTMFWQFNLKWMAIEVSEYLG